MSESTYKKWPWFGTVGLILLCVFWYLNWNLEGLRTHWAFFPMWLGFILLVNGIVYAFKGNCLLTESWKQFGLLFILSSPCWWIFEFLNERVQYWVYIPVNWFSRGEFIFYASLNFSVVLPGIFSLSELTALKFPKPRFPKPSMKFWIVGKDKITLKVLFVLGWVMLAITLLFPEYSMAFLWMSLFFIIDPVNYWLGYPSILRHTAKGDWRIIWILWIASIICGLAWELWNYYSFPKWLYSIPYVDFLYIFEMPVLGYLGYLPFSMELFAMYTLTIGLLGRNNRVYDFLK